MRFRWKLTFVIGWIWFFTAPPLLILTGNLSHHTLTWLWILPSFTLITLSAEQIEKEASGRDDDP